MKNIVKRFIQDESGQDLIEYTMLTAMIALLSAAIFVNVGSSVSAVWQQMSNQLSNAASSAS
jgi:Flp pilus assembly pilin Flp